MPFFTQQECRLSQQECRLSFLTAELELTTGTLPCVDRTGEPNCVQVVIHQNEELPGQMETVILGQFKGCPHPGR